MNSWLTKMQSDGIGYFYSGLRTWLVYLSGIILTFMSFMIVFDVFLRFVFNAPLPASVEISELMEPYVVFLPFAFTLAVGRHVRVTLIIERFPKSARLLTEFFVSLIDLLFFGICCYFSWAQFWASFKIREIMLAAIKLPWWAGKFGMPVGMFFIAIECILIAFRLLRHEKPEIE